MLGGGLALLFRHKTAERNLQLILAISGAYLLGITFIHLLPGIFADHNPNIAAWLLLGFLIQLLLGGFSKGVEHGHIHVHQHAPASYAWQIMFGLCLHALLEGLPLGQYVEFGHAHLQEDNANHLLWGVILHKAPAAFALVTLFLRSGYRLPTIGVCVFFFALMSPLGALISQYLMASGPLLTIVMATVAGSFLHISTTILFEADNANQHRISWQKLVAIVSGMFLAWLTL